VAWAGHFTRRSDVRFLEAEFIERVRDVSDSLVETLIERTILITETPAPTNEEGERARVVRDMLANAGFEDIRVDALHNVTGRIPGKNRNKMLLLAGHTDTVFPLEMPIRVERSNDRLSAPGVGDNSVSVAAVVTLKRALDVLGVVPETDIVVTGNVGEEGLGDLRGMRAVVDALPGLGAAIAVEGHSLSRITHRAIGSRRLKIKVKGPGGHSWGDAGRPSAIHHLAVIVSRLNSIKLKSEPKTSLNVGIFHGGISVNTIAAEAMALLDMRSESERALEDLVRTAQQHIHEKSPDGIEVSSEIVGDRPAGAAPRDRGIVPIGIAVLESLGIDVTCDASSTDANIPINRGIPAMCIGLTTGGNVHRLDEFIRIDPLRTGFAHLILTTLIVSDALSRDEL
jgi:acetylornithine deacetylase/succinyl-diaminopimelate desuccinylase-like protein